MKFIDKNKCKNPYFILFAAISILYVLLFAKFLIGDYAYFFLDMGNDTITINYPLYHLFSDMLKENSNSLYQLNVGLGMDMSSHMYQYLNPLNLFIILLPEGYITWGVIFLVYIKLMITGIFGYKFFYGHIKHEMSSVIAALVWTFSSYVMLWGQHYGFFTAIVMFTVFMYLVYVFVENSEQSKNWILVPWITLMLLSNYYFLFSSAVMGAGYVIIYLICKKAPVKKIMCKLLQLAAMGILGVLIGGIGFVAILDNFVSSARTGDIGVIWSHMFTPFSLQTVISMLGRFMSNNMMGIADDYTGVFNYYEMAMVFTSGLCVIAVVQLLRKKAYRKKTIGILVLIVVSMVFPFAGKVFNLTTGSLRWTYIVCFIEALAIGLAIREILENPDTRESFKSAVYGMILAVILAAIVVWGEYNPDYPFYQLEYKYIAIYLLFVFVYGICICLSAHNTYIRKKLSICMLIVVCIEMAVCNYPTINQREFATRQQLLTDYYHDGTEEAYDQLQQMDDSLYRVNKTYTSCSENDSLVQGYAGTSVYMTTNQKELIQLQQIYGGTAIGLNRILFDQDNYIFQTLLGEKYLFTEDPGVVSEDNYSYVETIGTIHIYENKNAVSFGYLYDEAWEKEQIEQMEEIDRSLAIVDGFYYTDGENAVGYDTAELGQVTETSLMDYAVTANDCAVTVDSDGITICDMEEDPFVVFSDGQSCFDESAIHKIHIDVETETSVDMAIYYKSQNEESFRSDKIYIFHVSPEQSVWEYIVPGDIDDIRVDISDNVSNVTIKQLDIINCTEDSDSLQELQNTNITQVTFADDCYYATINNDADIVKMLCVPLLYSNNWKVTIDGIETDVKNINGGLCGIEIDTGEHQVVMEYESIYKDEGLLLSGTGIGIYLVWISIDIIKKKKMKIK